MNVKPSKGGHMPLKRLATLLVVTAVAVAAVAAVAIASSARDAGPSGIHLTPLSKGTIGASVHAESGGIEINTKGRKDILVTAITVDPHGSFGWHRHPGPVLVAVSKGTLTVFEPHGHGCRRSMVSAGDAFIEGGGDVHLARNDGTTPVELNATFLAPAGTKDYLVPAPQPKGCRA
jgi:quercetin dioxygenase-like cupin family protein